MFHLSIGMKSVKVSEETWAELLILKAKWRARSLEEVIKRLLREVEKGG